MNEQSTISPVPKSILLVEDNRTLASYLKKRLEKAGYAIQIEHRGDKASYLISKLKPDLVILDVMLPGMNGDQICNTVRDSYFGKILMLTAINDINMEVTTLNTGADDYLTKPVKEPILLAHIAALLRRPQMTEKLTHIRFGGLCINLVQREVSLFDKQIELSPSEYELLVLLAKNADEVMDRDNITYALKGHEYDGVDRNIDLVTTRRIHSSNSPFKAI